MNFILKNFYIVLYCIKFIGIVKIKKNFFKLKLFINKCNLNKKSSYNRIMMIILGYNNNNKTNKMYYPLFRHLVIK